MFAGEKGKFSLLDKNFSIITTPTQHSINYLFPSSGEVTVIVTVTVTLTQRQSNHN